MQGTLFLTLVALIATAGWLVLWVRYRRVITQLRVRLREFETKLDGATPDEVRRRIDSLQTRLARVEPRRLTGKQKAVLQRVLTLPESAGITDIDIAYDAACGDGKEYAADFIRVLASCCGWQPFGVTVFGSSPRPESGLAIVCYRQGRTAAGAKVLSKAFTEAGIDHETIHSMEERLELAITSGLSSR